MSNDKDNRDNLVWAETIIRDRQNVVKNKADTTDKLKIIVYVIIGIIFVILLIYIINRAYRTPDPPSILDEIKLLTNQVDPSGTEGFGSD